MTYSQEYCCVILHDMPLKLAVSEIKVIYFSVCEYLYIITQQCPKRITVIGFNYVDIPVDINQSRYLTYLTCILYISEGFDDEGKLYSIGRIVFWDCLPQTIGYIYCIGYLEKMYKK